MRTLYFDCASGASGDMIVGALIDAGADFKALHGALRSLGVPGFTIAAKKVNKRGIVATQFLVCVDVDHDHPHRHLEDVLKIIEGGELPSSVKAAAAETFRRIAVCEAEIHGADVDAVHFHEIGAIDSIADIVGAHLALHLLGVERVLASALNLGSGTVKTAHGILPVPAPATVKLLQGIPCYTSEVEAELVTPTGAALISQCAASYGPLPQVRIESIGYGSGARDLPDRANVLRVLIGEISGAPIATESITIIEANIDDMNPELLPSLVADLIAKGARDTFLTPILGKKGRPAYLLTVMCDETMARDLVPLVFYGSTTLGVRLRTEQRICLDREWRTAHTAWGDVRVKIGRFEGQITCMSPEFEDCRRIAEERGVPVLAVYEVAHAAAVKGELDHA